ncbi:hypothetical protein IMG5_168830, partial [Ichthyophthirius multifiliis]
QPVQYYPPNQNYNPQFPQPVGQNMPPQFQYSQQQLQEQPIITYQQQPVTMQNQQVQQQKLQQPLQPVQVVVQNVKKTKYNYIYQKGISQYSLNSKRNLTLNKNKMPCLYQRNYNNDIIQSWLTYLYMLFYLLFTTGCCCIPFCCNNCQDVIHTCPSCNANVGSYEYKIM